MKLLAHKNFVLFFGPPCMHTDSTNSV